MKSEIQALLRQALQHVADGLGQPCPVVNVGVDATKDRAHGDFASNIAMVAAKPLGQNPRALAQQLVAALPTAAWVTKVEIAGPGFLNFFLDSAAITAIVPQILATGAQWGQDRSGAKGKVMVEFVSANPTGPMHIGHGRGAAYGDTLANLLAATGWDVQREYYINDAGRQVDVLTVSVWLRYLEAHGQALAFPQRGYPADYIHATAARLTASVGAGLVHPAAAVLEGLPAEPSLPEGADDATKDATKLGQERYFDALIQRAKQLLGAHYATVQRAGLDDQLATIRATLGSFNVQFDHWYSEADLVASGYAQRAVQRLRDKGHTYIQDGAEWLRTSAFGDEKDRVLFKADGAATYFANDLAYHVAKLDRGFPLLIDVWGADHHGYIARVRAAIEMLTERRDALEVALMQFVTLSSGRMGKRSGNFVTLQDLLDEAGPDATRFYYLSRSHDQHLEFDVELAKKQDKDNPVYYPQYAHARICSVFRQVEERGLQYQPEAGLAALARLDTDEDKSLLQTLARYPELLRVAAANRTPHTLAFYLKDLAEAFHGYYHAHKVLVDDAALMQARLVLFAATRTVLAGALHIMGVSAPQSM